MDRCAVTERGDQVSGGEGGRAAGTACASRNKQTGGESVSQNSERKWLRILRLLAGGVALTRFEAERYGDCLTSPVSHIDYWTELQHNGKVSRDVEYEELPRGRVVFDVRKQQFTVYADCCILMRQDVVHQIVAQMALPSNVPTAPDAHYRCYHCIYHPRRSTERDQ